MRARASVSGQVASSTPSMLEMAQHGAYAIAQDEASCVVFGMPRQAIAAGGVREIAPLSEIAGRLEGLTLS